VPARESLGSNPCRAHHAYPAYTYVTPRSCMFVNAMSIAGTRTTPGRRPPSMACCISSAVPSPAAANRFDAVAMVLRHARKRTPRCCSASRPDDEVHVWRLEMIVTSPHFEHRCRLAEGVAVPMLLDVEHGAVFSRESSQPCVVGRGSV